MFCDVDGRCRGAFVKDIFRGAWDGLFHDLPNTRYLWLMRAEKRFQITYEGRL